MPTYGPKMLICEGYDPDNAIDLVYAKRDGKAFLFSGTASQLSESERGCQIVESLADVGIVPPVSEAAADDKWTVDPKTLFIVEGVFQRWGTKNANGRTYPRELFEGIVGDPKSAPMQAIAERRMTGHLEHPGDGRSNIKEYAILTTDLKLVPDRANGGKSGVARGRAELLETPNGAILRSLSKHRIPWGVSSRGTGSVDESGNVKWSGKGEDDDFKLITFDAVDNPSTPGARNFTPVGSVRENSMSSPAEAEAHRIAKDKLPLQSYGRVAPAIPDGSPIPLSALGPTDGAGNTDAVPSSDATSKINSIPGDPQEPFSRGADRDKAYGKPKGEESSPAVADEAIYGESAIGAYEVHQARADTPIVRHYVGGDLKRAKAFAQSISAQHPESPAHVIDCGRKRGLGEWSRPHISYLRGKVYDLRANRVIEGHVDGSSLYGEAVTDDEFTKANYRPDPDDSYEHPFKGIKVGHRVYVEHPDIPGGRSSGTVTHRATSGPGVHWVTVVSHKGPEVDIDAHPDGDGRYHIDDGLHVERAKPKLRAATESTAASARILSWVNEAAERLDEKGIARLFKHMDSDAKGYAIVSAHRGDRTKRENEAHSAALEAHLRRRGYGYHHVDGAYVENPDTPNERVVRERSFFIPGVSSDEAAALAKHAYEHHQQDSVLHGHGKDGAHLMFGGSGERVNVGDQAMAVNADEAHRFFTLYRNHKFIVSNRHRRPVESVVGDLALVDPGSAEADEAIVEARSLIADRATANEDRAVLRRALADFAAKAVSPMLRPSPARFPSAVPKRKTAKQKRPAVVGMGVGESELDEAGSVGTLSRDLISLRGTSDTTIPLMILQYLGGAAFTERNQVYGYTGTVDGLEFKLAYPSGVQSPASIPTVDCSITMDNKGTYAVRVGRRAKTRVNAENLKATFASLSGKADPSIRTPQRANTYAPESAEGDDLDAIYEGGRVPVVSAPDLVEENRRLALMLDSAKGALVKMSQSVTEDARASAVNETGGTGMPRTVAGGRQAAGDEKSASRKMLPKTVSESAPIPATAVAISEGASRSVQIFRSMRAGASA